MLIILGLSNPHPGYVPLDPGGFGQRLWKMSGLSRNAYLKIRRHNLDDFSDAEEFRASINVGDTVIVLGDQVRRKLWLERQLILPIVRGGVTYRQIPHPSGANLFYNDPLNRKLVEVLFRCLTNPDSLMSAEALMATFASGRPSPRRSRS